MRPQRLRPRAATPLPIIPMARFRRLMLRQGLGVDLPRLSEDRRYAYECLALAQGCDDAALRRAASALFAAYDEPPTSPSALH